MKRGKETKNRMYSYLLKMCLCMVSTHHFCRNVSILLISVGTIIDNLADGGRGENEKGK